LGPLFGWFLELNPWIKPWHDDMERNCGCRLSDSVASSIADEARTLGMTVGTNNET
jgi:hypothetical protein